MKRHVSKVVDSPIGKLTLVATDDGLAAILWANDRPSRVRLNIAAEDAAHPVLKETERQLAVRQPAGPLVDGLLGEEVRQREQDARQTDEDDGDDLPAFEVQHLSTDPVCR